MRLKPVTVVILNWNGKKWLEQFLATVVLHSQPLAHILLIDNASTDDSVSWIQAHFPDVEVVVLDKNYGFTGGNNRALPYIHTRYYILLNSDVEVTEGWITPLLQRMEDHPQMASLQPKIRAYHRKAYFEYAGAAGGWVDRWIYPFCRGRVFETSEKDEGQYDDFAEVFWATGACCMIRKSVTDEIGLFDEDFFAHMEEIDFCWRAKNFGYTIGYEPNSLVYHVGGGTLHTSHPYKTYLNIHNSLVMMTKNLPDGKVFSKVLVRLLLDGVWVGKLLLNGHLSMILSIIKAHWAFFGRLGYIRRKRKTTYPKGVKTMPSEGYYPHTLIWQYWVKKRTAFRALMG